MAAKLNRDVIARAGLEQLEQHGLDGLTMRTLAAALSVQAPTLYWHVKNKRELLDAMADVMAMETYQRLHRRCADETARDWMAEVARIMRSGMLRYRDGARVFVGSLTPAARLSSELVLSELRDAGFSVEAGAQAMITVLHYVTGSVIEEQARTGIDYADNPYLNVDLLDAKQFPLSAQARTVLFDPDADASFEAGLAMVLAGITTTLGEQSPAQKP